MKKSSPTLSRGQNSLGDGSGAAKSQHTVGASARRAAEASGCLSFPPLWETSGQSLVTVRLRPSWGRLRSSEIAAYRRGVAELKPPAALAFPPYGRRLCGV